MQDARFAATKNFLTAESFANLEDAQYSSYVFGLLCNIPFLSLWDHCFLIAISMSCECTVPKSINGVDLKLLYETIEYNDEGISFSDEARVLLEPVQKWLSEQFVNSIEKKEIDPIIVGRYADGRIDAKRTYIDGPKINEWLLCRGIQASTDDYEIIRHCNRSLEHIHFVVMTEAAFLVAKAYNPDFVADTKIPPACSRDIDYLLIENSRLRAQIESPPSRQLKKVHGNAERFALNREPILGAALYVVTQWPHLCKDDTGKYEARKIANLVEEKSLVIWPETGKAPLALESMERVISKWINQIGK